MSTDLSKELIEAKFEHIQNACKGANLFGEIYLKHKFESAAQYDQIINSKDWGGINKYGNSFEISEGLFVKVIME